MNDVTAITAQSSANARLPQAYEAAKVAIAHAAKVDECKTWADKAEAIASYARQADDETLLRHAQRIKARAIERCGALLREFAPQRGKRNDLQPGTGTGTKSRKQAADEAGLSKRQRDTALRVNAYATSDPKGFEKAVEAPKPATVTELADRGTKKRPPAPPQRREPPPPKPKAKPLVDLKGRHPSDFKAATDAMGRVEWLHDYVAKSPRVEPIVRGLSARERSKVSTQANACIEWLSELLKEIENA